ncbi:hypothetical protein BMJ33_26395 [Sinorhizobium medicae]|uniref:Uncharacterized protein n=1 Tax=Sinorhizobium medicae TaxID=110321 RepID=A0ABX4TF69_9HYPH|nr:hypothetical protein BMJ33_26395 [Sinorhizobium medicae]
MGNRPPGRLHPLEAMNQYGAYDFIKTCAMSFKENQAFTPYHRSIATAPGLFLRSIPEGHGD